MCGRVVQSSPQAALALGIVEGMDDRDSRYGNVPPRFNGAPSQQLWVIRRDRETGRPAMDLLRWGLLPSFMTSRPKPPPINARAEGVAGSRLFGRAYERRRCIVPIDAFYEWRIAGAGRPKQPYAVARPDRRPLGLAGLWENWRDPATGEWVRSFCILTRGANDQLAPLHDRMPVILPPNAYERWLGPEPDPRDLLGRCPLDTLELWPVSARVNSPRTDEPDLLDPIGPAGLAATEVATADADQAV